MAVEKTRQQKAKARQHRRDRVPPGPDLHGGAFLYHLNFPPIPKLVSVPQGQKAILFSEQMLGDVDKTLNARNSSVEKYLEAQLVKFLNIKLIHGLDDTLTFGQYSGMNVREICQTDLDYMYWLVIEQNSKKFDGKTREYVQYLASQDLRRSR